MNRLKDMWGTQDVINRVAFIAAIAGFVWCIIEGHGLYGVVLAVVLVFLIVSRRNQRERRFGRLYGAMYFFMPDGEVVPRTFEQVKNDYVRGGQKNYAGRRVEVRFPWWYLNTEGDIDTGFGLMVRVKDRPELLAEAKTLHRGDCVRAVGEVVAAGKSYFYVGELEELQRISEKELYYPLKKQ